MTVTQHIHALHTKTIAIMITLGRMSHSVRGLRFPLLRTYYKVIFLPIVAYGVAAWGDFLTTRNNSQLQTLQRHTLIKLTKAYATTSTAALQVVAGCMPLDIYIHMIRRIYKYSRLGHRRFGTADLTDCTGRANARKLLLDSAIMQWEERWRNSAEATHHYFPSLLRRDKMMWLTPNHAVTQFVNGHGHFQLKLYQQGLTQTPLCDCGELDSPPHMLFDCGLYTIYANIYKPQ